MGTFLLTIGLIMSLGGMFLVGYEAFIMGSLQSTASMMQPQTVQDVATWFVLKLGNGWDGYVKTVLDWPRVVLLVTFGMLFLIVGWRLSHSRRKMN